LEDNNSEQQPKQADASPVLPPGWRLELKIGPDAEGELSGVAEVWQGRVMRCRLVITRYGQDRKASIARVNARVEYWLSEWLARPHRGDTDFTEL